MSVCLCVGGSDDAYACGLLCRYMQSVLYWQANVAVRQEPVPDVVPDNTDESGGAAAAPATDAE